MNSGLGPRLKPLFVCSDLGAEKNGARLGPLAILGEVFAGFGEYYATPGKRSRARVERPLHGTEIRELNNWIFKWYKEAQRNSKVPLVIAGDHSIAAATVAGCRMLFKNVLVVWIDAHPDLNTVENTPSQLAHGMALASGLGFESSISPSNQNPDQTRIVFIGARSFDPGELDWIQQHKPLVIRPAELRKQRLAKKLCGSAMGSFAFADHIHLSIDIDALDPRFFPGVNSPAEDGMLLDDLLWVIEKVIATNKVVSIDLVEYNPKQDINRATLSAAGQILRNIYGKAICEI